MQRREFLTAATSAAALALTAAHTSAQQQPAQDASASATTRWIPELRVYHFASALKQQAYEEFLAQAAIDAYDRAGAEPVGVFRWFEKDNPDPKSKANPTDLYVLLAHKSVGSVLQFEQRLRVDEKFQKAGEAILRADRKEPAYTGYESSLFRGFESFPQVQAPSKSPERLLQLRIYQSHTNERGLKKIEMFEKGETAIFRRTGLHPVFMGQALTGDKLPNLTYMCAFDNKEALDKAWNAFRDDPEWKTLSKDPAYKDTVSNITSLILRPATRSQI